MMLRAAFVNLGEGHAGFDHRDRRVQCRKHDVVDLFGSRGKGSSHRDGSCDIRAGVNDACVQRDPDTNSNGVPPSDAFVNLNGVQHHRH